MMDLVTITENKATTTSLIIAEVFEKQHKNILRDISNLECSAKFTELNFEPSAYKDSTGRMLPVYNITRDGFTFLAMGFTGKKAADFKERFIEAFNAMEQALHSGPKIRQSFDIGKLPRFVDKRIQSEFTLRLAHHVLGVPVADLMAKTSTPELPAYYEIMQKLADCLELILRDDDPQRLRVKRYTNERGRQCVEASTAKILYACETMAREHGIPPFRMSTPQFGARISASLDILAEFGWLRHRGPTICGDRRWCYEKVEG